MLTISTSFLWIAPLIMVGVQLIKWGLNKWLPKATKFIPYALFVILTAIYWGVSGNFATGIINGLLLTALSVYAYDIVKPIIEAIKAKIHK